MNGSFPSASLPSPADAWSSVPANMRRQKSLLRRIERCCTVSLKHFPLLFVYGVTTWAVYTGVRVCFVLQVGSAISYIALALLVIFYCLLNWSYTVAVFTDPGSPIDPPSATAPFSFSLRRKDSASRGEYSYLPTIEPSEPRPDSPPASSHNANHPYSSQGRLDQASVRSLTVKSTGGLRFCKKCRTRKPDRAHHCSTCGRCVLKMDHHCPWLATCVGLKNYKPFLLFCAYVTLFCCVCFAVAASFVSNGMMSDRLQMNGDWFAVNVILLAIMGAIFGLVLAAFTGWHISLTLRNQTTIEALETTRYLRPIRRTMDRATAAFPARGGGTAGGGGPDEDEGLMHQLAEMHANAVPGVTREEEGEERASPPRSPGRSFSPAHRRPAPSAPPPHPGQPIPPPSTAARALQTSYAQLEAQRERARYEDYLDEQETSKMPHAFDRGWRQNVRDLFGPDWRLWLLPLPSTPGDGWAWTPSDRWLRAQEERQRRREERARQAAAYDDPAAGTGYDHGPAYANGYADGLYDPAAAPPTSIPHAYDGRADDGAAAPDGEHDDGAFRGVDAPLGKSWRGNRGRGHARGASAATDATDADTRSVDALFARDDDQDEEGEHHAARRPSVAGSDVDGDDEPGRRDSEAGWRW